MKSFSVTTYAALRRKVEETLLLGQRKIEEAKVLTYWQTGRYINEHIRVNGGRAEYGEQVILKLSRDLKVGDELLYRCSRFAALLPISSSWRKLSWTHLRALCRVPDDRKRLELLEQTVRNEWPSAVLEAKIRNLNWEVRAAALEGKPPSLLPVPVLGPFYTYQITNLDEFSKTRRVVVGARATTIQPESIHPAFPSRVLDIGFSVKLDMARFPACRLPAGSIVSSTKGARGNYSLREVPRAKGQDPRDSMSSVARGSWNVDQLYTYKAYVEKVIDGDTLKVQFDVGFGEWRGEPVRLRGIDCPEIDTAEGKRAKAFVEAELKGCNFIIVKSTQTRREKWGRYLADIFYEDKSGKQIYLNNLLLEKGHAVRVRY